MSSQHYPVPRSEVDQVKLREHCWEVLRDKLKADGQRAWSIADFAVGAQSFNECDLEIDCLFCFKFNCVCLHPAIEQIAVELVELGVTDFTVIHDSICLQDSKYARASLDRATDIVMYRMNRRAEAMQAEQVAKTSSSTAQDR